MSFEVRKTRPAEEDLLEAALWYDCREPGLGDQFLNEVDAAVAALAEHAFLSSVKFEGARRAPVRRFKKYGVWYVQRAREVIVFAVVHGRRSPRWVRLRRKLLG